MEYRKVCVEVIAKFSSEGGMRPIKLKWRDGEVYLIDRVRFAERAPARVSAILPIRYTCLIGGREKYLYFEPDKMQWFVEVLGA